MALQLKTKHSTIAKLFGLFRTPKTNMLDAYIRVERVEGTKHLVHATVSLEDVKAGYESSTFIEFSPDMNGANFITQAYAHLKTLPEYKGAVDV